MYMLYAVFLRSGRDEVSCAGERDQALKDGRVDRILSRREIKEALATPVHLTSNYAIFIVCHRSISVTVALPCQQQQHHRPW
jgi:hypothetical protein